MQERQRPVDFFDMAMPAGIVLMLLGAGDLLIASEHGTVHAMPNFKPLVFIGLIMVAVGAIAHQVRR